MRRNKLDRILYIHQILVQGGVLNKQQAADHFNVSTKTIQRDLDILRTYFADSEPRREIIYHSSPGGYFLDDAQNRCLTGGELLAVCKVLLESRSMVREELFPILDKLLQSSMTLNRSSQICRLISRERFHYAEPEHGRRLLDALWKIGTAMEKRSLLEITFPRSFDEKNKTCAVAPVGIFCRDSYFYLAGFPEGTDKNRHFQALRDSSPAVCRIDRIEHLRTLNRPCQNLLPEEWRKKQSQFPDGNKLQKIRFRYTGPLIEALLDRLPTAEVQATTEDGWVIEAVVLGAETGVLLDSMEDFSRLND